MPHKKHNLTTGLQSGAVVAISALMIDRGLFILHLENDKRENYFSI
jgi:hypothetical protein